MQSVYRYHINLAPGRVRLAVIMFDGNGHTIAFNGTRKPEPHDKCELFLDTPDRPSYWSKVEYDHNVPPGTLNYSLV